MGKKIYYENDCFIILVTPIITSDLSEKDVEDLNNKKWVIKILNEKRFSENEVGRISAYELYNCIHSIKFPKNVNYRSGRYEKISWYVIEYLPDCIKSCTEQIKDNLNKFVTDIINFLEWLHVKKNKVHGDIKSANIVCDISKNIYRLIDFEHTFNINHILCMNDIPNGYYYYAFGCEYDKPYTSYRNDLESFGYILWNIIESKNNVFELFDWQLKAISYYSEENCTNNFVYLEDLKKNHNIKKPHIIKQYFDIISELDWNETCPSKEIYEKIRNIFTSFSLIK